MQSLSILIVNYNTELFIGQLLLDIDNQTLNKNSVEIIIVNNVQNPIMENTIQNNPILKRMNTKVIQSNINIGFGRAMNLAADSAKNDLLLIANPDLKMLRNDYLENLISKHTKIAPNGISTTKQLNEFNVDTSEYQSYEFGITLGYTDQINWFCGALLLISKDTFNTINGFDPDFFMYCEDEDLCLRIKEKGLPLNKINDLEIFHKGGSSEPLKDFSFYQRWEKSKILFAYKHYDHNTFTNVIKNLEKKSKQKVFIYRYLNIIKSNKNKNSLNKWLAIQDCINRTKEDINWLFFKVK